MAIFLSKPGEKLFWEIIQQIKEHKERNYAYFHYKDTKMSRNDFYYGLKELIVGNILKPDLVQKYHFPINFKLLHQNGFIKIDIMTLSGSKTHQYKTKDNEIRTTFLVKEDFNKKIKSYAYFNRVLVKDIVNEALKDWITKTEAKEGIIQSLPPRKTIKKT